MKMEIRILEKLDNIIKILKGEQIEDGYMDINGVVKYTIWVAKVIN